MTDDPADSRRLQQARDRYDAAVLAEQQTRDAAAPARVRQAHRRAAGVRLVVVAAVITALGLLLAGWWAHGSADSMASTAADDQAAREAAEHAVVTMLTADPAHADRYVQDILSVSTGDQRIRIQGARDELEKLVAAQPRSTSGQVLSSGVVGTEGDKTTILLVAQATSPELIGGDPSQNRVGVTATMVQVDGRWLVQQTEAVS
ncbi:hypothetical protein [Gordonia neofelifaecis]|uniref:Putative membrane glycoprotein n=1 Tax=Gordonia neofelifaecis NRRL B-59395 TaxID=644548 RepID=F1YNW8_9ACTN|nr:hypothetical protein [Gordonia neofelifaecis]EGD53587.1 putative membrane glycoprotein [Gordonia neofelifaecis NRRL B-59395]